MWPLMKINSIWEEIYCVFMTLSLVSVVIRCRNHSHVDCYSSHFDFLLSSTGMPSLLALRAGERAGAGRKLTRPRELSVGGGKSLSSDSNSIERTRDGTKRRTKRAEGVCPSEAQLNSLTRLSGRFKSNKKRIHMQFTNPSTHNITSTNISTNVVYFFLSSPRPCSSSCASSASLVYRSLSLTPPLTPASRFIGGYLVCWTDTHYVLRKFITITPQFRKVSIEAHLKNRGEGK